MAKFTLENFYISTEWEKFRANYLADRLQRDGELIDDETGEIILRKYDAVLHHKIHLTEENVNDYNVSLNPSNIELVSMRTHNIIHGKSKYYSKKVFITSKDPTTINRNFDLIVDFDTIHKAIGGGDRIFSNVWVVYNVLIDNVRYKHGKWVTALVVCKKNKIDFNHLKNMLEAEEIE